MRNLHLLGLSVLCALGMSSCLKGLEENIDNETVNINLSVNTTDFVINEGGMQTKALDGAGGASVNANDFYFYVLEKNVVALNTASKVNPAETPSFSGLKAGVAYDIYASTAPYTEAVNNISEGDLSFPTRDPRGELYEGKLSTASLTAGDHSFTVDVELKVFQIDVDVLTNKGAIQELVSGFYVQVTQGAHTLKWAPEDANYDSSKSKAFFKPSENDIEIGLYDKANNYIKGTTILAENAVAGKCFDISITTNLSANIVINEINIIKDWDDEPSAIEF